MVRELLFHELIVVLGPLVVARVVENKLIDMRVVKVEIQLAHRLHFMLRHVDHIAYRLPLQECVGGDSSCKGALPGQ